MITYIELDLITFPLIQLLNRDLTSGSLPGTLKEQISHDYTGLSKVTAF
jgi:hypothetical protein